jgi:hypothetical protein
LLYYTLFDRNIRTRYDTEFNEVRAIILLRDSSKCTQKPELKTQNSNETRLVLIYWKQLKPWEENQWGGRDEINEMIEFKIQSHEPGLGPGDETSYGGYDWVERQVWLRMKLTEKESRHVVKH